MHVPPAAELRERAEQIEALKRLPWIDTDGASFILEMSSSMIRKLIDQKVLPAIKLGRKLYRLRPGDVINLIGGGSS